MTKLLHVVSAAVLCVVLGGCSGLQGIAQPTVEVVDARVVEQSSQGASVAVTLRVANPNVKELAMPRVTCDLDVEGAGRFTFTDVPYATVPGRGEQFVTVPAGVLGSGLAGKRYSVQGAVVFQQEGQLRRVMSDIGVPLPRSGFSAQGVLQGDTLEQPAP
ncbi:MAG: hypothetical protein ACIAXF_16635 [Phycisphaerales bacterium JB063]